MVTDRKELFDRPFSVSGEYFADVADNSAFLASGLGKHPVEIKPEDGDDGTDSFCHNKCFSHKAERVKAPFLAGNQYFSG